MELERKVKFGDTPASIHSIKQEIPDLLIAHVVNRVKSHPDARLCAKVNSFDRWCLLFNVGQLLIHEWTFDDDHGWNKVVEFLYDNVQSTRFSPDCIPEFRKLVLERAWNEIQQEEVE